MKTCTTRLIKEMHMAVSQEKPVKANKQCQINQKIPELIQIIQMRLEEAEMPDI